MAAASQAVCADDQVADAVRQADAICNHWSVESHNGVMNMVLCVMPEARIQHDEFSFQRNNGPANFATIKHIANNPMRTRADKLTGRAKCCLASSDDDYLASLIPTARSCPFMRFT